MWVTSVEQAVIPATHLDLITDDGALSKRLKTKCQTLSVQLQCQTLATAFSDEQALLNIREQTSFIRKSHLLGDGKLWIFGRIVVPHATYRAWQHDFDNLGNQLLGETLLYNRPNLIRSPFQYAQINEQIWGRRSVFTVDQHKLLVTELFLPAVFAHFDSR